MDISMGVARNESPEPPLDFAGQFLLDAQCFRQVRRFWHVLLCQADMGAAMARIAESVGHLKLDDNPDHGLDGLPGLPPFVGVCLDDPVTSAPPVSANSIV